MAPLRNRAHRTQNDQDQMIEGLPIRNWRRIESNIGAPVEEQAIIQHSRWPELPMPRESHLLSDMSRQLLRLARLPKVMKPASAAEDDMKDHREEEEAIKATDRKGFTVRKWSQMTRDYSAPDRDYLAKRRKGLPPQDGYNSIYGPLGQAAMFRTVKVKKFDGDGIAHVYEVMAPVGVAVEGELPETDGGLSGPLEPRQPPGTIIDGIGIANEDGVIVAQPTPSRRKPPPPPRRRKKYFGRNKKKIETQYGADGLPIHPPGPSDGLTAEEGLTGQDIQMGEANENEQDEEDEEGSGEEGEGEDGDDGDDHESDGDDREDASATPIPQISVSKSETPDVPAISSEPVAVPSSLRSEVKFEHEIAPIASPPASSAPQQSPDLARPPVEASVTSNEQISATTLDLERNLETSTSVLETMEPELAVAPPIPEIAPDLSEASKTIANLAAADSIAEPLTSDGHSGGISTIEPSKDSVPSTNDKPILPEIVYTENVAVTENEGQPTMRPSGAIPAPVEGVSVSSGLQGLPETLSNVPEPSNLPNFVDVQVHSAVPQEDTLTILEDRIEKPPSPPPAPVLEPVEPVESSRLEENPVIPDDLEKVVVPTLEEQTPLPPVEQPDAGEQRGIANSVPVTRSDDVPSVGSDTVSNT